MTVAHTFARIAPAPYTFVSIVKSAQEIKAGRNPVEAFCEHCGSCIHNVVTFRGSDGREFVIGLDCAKKAGESVTKHAKVAKDAEILADAATVLAPYARSFYLTATKGAYIQEGGKSGKALAKAFKPYVKLGLVAVVKDWRGEVRVHFTADGVRVFGSTPGLLCPLRVSAVDDSWTPVR